MAQKEHPCPGRDPSPYGFDYVVGGSDRQGDGVIDITRPSFSTYETPGTIQRAVLVIGGQHLVAGLKGQRAGYHVEPSGGVGHVDEVVGGGVQVRTECLTSGAHQGVETAAKEFHRLALELQLPGLIGLKYRPGTGAKGAVVQEDDIGSQEE